MIISSIVAHSKNMAIGYQGKIPWRLSDDFKNYKKITMGHCLIMGRKTFESIGRALPGRTSIILTRNSLYQAPKGCHICASLDEAIELAKELGDDECFINGGGEIYKQSMKLIDKMYITKVDAIIEPADAFFPKYNLDEWQLQSSFDFPKDDKNNYDWTFFEYVKK